MVKMGNKIFTYLVKITPNNGHFPLDTKLFYDIKINNASLKDFNLTTGKNSIVYGNDKLPSFVVPNKHTNIIHGSCRKPHAANKSSNPQYDQMLTADALLNKTINK